MKAIIICTLSCLSALAADTSDMRVVTTTDTNTQPGILLTIDEFTRGGQTNLVRHTYTKDGVVSFRTQRFYHDGKEVGNYTYLTANGTNTAFGSVPGAPYYLNILFDSSNRPMSAQIMATNLKMVDWFLCTNGVFCPAESSSIRESNARLPKGLPLH